MLAPPLHLHSATRLNATLVGMLIAASLLLLFVVPAWLLPASPWWGLLLVPVALATNTMWSLIHEAIHGHLFRERRWNDRAGRLLCVLYGAPFRALRVAHLLHHRYSRTRRDRTEVYDPARTSRFAATAGFYVQLLGGMYFLEVLSSLACLLPRRAIDRLAPRLDHGDTTGGRSSSSSAWPSGSTDRASGCSAPSSSRVPPSFPSPTTPTITPHSSSNRGSQ